MREGRLERRLARAMRAASDALRAAAHALEELSEEHGHPYREDFDRRERDDRIHGEGDSHYRDSEPDRNHPDDDDCGRAGDCAGNKDDRFGAEAHSPLPPYPPFSPYPPFPPYPPMPPIIIACACRDGAGHFFAGPGYGLSAQWPVPAFGVANAAPPPPAAMQASAAQGGAAQSATSTFVSSAPPFQWTSATAVPAGGLNFAVQASAASRRPDPDGEPGPRHE
jgi:hypothetical protein